jgi:hypothetical protein
LADEEDEEEE